MQDINNKLAELLETLTNFFENFVDELAEVKTNQATAIQHLANINTKLDAISAKEDSIISLLTDIKTNTNK